MDEIYKNMSINLLRFNSEKIAKLEELKKLTPIVAGAEIVKLSCTSGDSEAYGRNSVDVSEVLKKHYGLNVRNSVTQLVIENQGFSIHVEAKSKKIWVFRGIPKPMPNKHLMEHIKPLYDMIMAHNMKKLKGKKAKKNIKEIYDKLDSGSKWKKYKACKKIRLLTHDLEWQKETQKLIDEEFKKLEEMTVKWKSLNNSIRQFLKFHPAMVELKEAGYKITPY